MVRWPGPGYDELGVAPEDAVVVLTHDPKLDDPAITEAVRRGVGFIGALGSRRTQEKRFARLRESGLTEDELARVSGPVGLDIGAHTPEETAVSILAEVIASRSGRDGGRLISGTGGIHVIDESLEARVPARSAESMIIQSAFTVAARPDDVYRLMLDVEQVAPCIPGAHVTGRRDDGGLRRRREGQARAGLDDLPRHRRRRGARRRRAHREAAREGERGPRPGHGAGRDVDGRRGRRRRHVERLGLDRPARQRPRGPDGPGDHAGRRDADDRRDGAQHGGRC